MSISRDGRSCDNFLRWLIEPPPSPPGAVRQAAGEEIRQEGDASITLTRLQGLLPPRQHSHGESSSWGEAFEREHILTFLPGPQ